MLDVSSHGAGDALLSALPPLLFGAAAPATLLVRIDREDASSIVTAGATANTTEGNSRASRESGLLCSHSHGESIGVGVG